MGGQPPVRITTGVLVLQLIAPTTLLAEPAPSKREASFDKALARCVLDDALPDFRAVPPPPAPPAAVDFFGDRHGAELIVGGKDFFEVSPEPGRLTLRIDNLTDSWSYDIIINRRGQPSVALPDDDRSKALFQALEHGKVLHLDATGTRGAKDYELALERISIALPEWLSCVAQTRTR
jgi:hypothetical protein